MKESERSSSEGLRRTKPKLCNNLSFVFGIRSPKDNDSNPDEMKESERSSSEGLVTNPTLIEVYLIDAFIAKNKLKGLV